jgi:hypothetical protein
VIPFQQPMMNGADKVGAKSKSSKAQLNNGEVSQIQLNDEGITALQHALEHRWCAEVKDPTFES